MVSAQMTNVCRRIVDKSDASPQEFWQIFLQSSLIVIRESVGRFVSG